MLTEGELWQRVTQLTGRTIPTLQRKKPNIISHVTDNAIEIERRKSKPSRAEMYSLYKQVHETSEVLASQARRWTWAITYAILIEVANNEIEAVPGQLGIRLCNST